MIHTCMKNMIFERGGSMPGGKHMLGMGKNRVFGTAKVGDRGQIVIPQEARRFFGMFVPPCGVSVSLALIQTG